MYPEGGQYEFALVDKNFKEYDEENSLVILYQNGGIVYRNPYLRYFPYAEKMVLKYIDLINKENTTELAGFLNPDDLAVPDWVADEVI
ncbi:hypothetical protein PALU110988_24885 [Paenibacillus lupini]|uniref:hypothetical protein n=1 Tax=Paenibacillus lupini TaxID=1450204 RepID=UPI0014241CB1|nr:hypothetical protein [Paenibacillus lupini]NIK21725.1 hypothetical protein [Paenibacillus lupini]